MTDDGDGMEWVVDPVDPILLNALVDRHGASSPAVSDEASRSLVTSAFEGAVDEEVRKMFDDVAERVQSGEKPTDDEKEVIGTVVGAVREQLADDGVSVALTHKNSMRLSPTEAILYTFSRTRDPRMLTELDVSTDVQEAITDAVESIESEDWKAAADELEDAVDAALTISDGVVTRTLAALCHHWSGADQEAIDRVGETVTLDSDSWLPWLPGYSADADPAYATPDQFRSDKYAVAAFLRFIAKVPEQATVTPAIGYSTDSDIEWDVMDGDDICFPIGRLDEETHIRFDITGPVDAFPAFQAYYIGLGIVDLEVNEIRDVLDVLEDGPTGERVTETVRFEQSNE